MKTVQQDDLLITCYPAMSFSHSLVSRSLGKFRVLQVLCDVHLIAYYSEFLGGPYSWFEI